MAVLPRYRRLGVEAQAPTRIDFSPMREVAGVGQAISQNVDRMGDFIYREQVRRAEMAGQEAVREQGAIPILQRLSEQGGPGISIAEQSAYEAANLVAVSEIQFEAENQITALLQSATDSNTPFSAVNTQLEDIVDGFSASLGYLNPEAAGLLQARLRNSTTDASRRYASAYQAKARAAAAERRSDVAAGFATSALELARVEGSTPETLFSSLQENRQALIDSGMSDEHADRWFNNAYSTAVRDNMLYRVMTAPLTDLRTMVETPPTEPLPGMTYAETLTEYGRVQTIYNSRLTGYESDARALGGRIDTAFSVLGSGGTVGPEALAQMTEEADRLYFISPELRTSVDRLNADNTFISNIRGMNQTELEMVLEQYTGGMPGVGEAGIDTPVEVFRRDVVANALNAANRAAAEATAEALEAAEPDLRLLRTAAGVVDAAMSSPNPNPLVVEEAFAQMVESFNHLPREIVTEEMLETMAAARQTKAAIESWRESQPAELAAELDRLRTAIPSTEDLPEGVELIDQMAINQRQANLLSSFMNAQQSALANGSALAYAQSQDVMIEDPVTGEPRIVGQPINFAGDMASIQASIEQRFRDVDYVESRFNVRGQDVLLPGELGLIQSVLRDGLPSQQAEMLGLIAGLGQERAMRIFDDLGEENRQASIYAHVGGLFVEGLPDVANSILRGMALEAPPALSGQDPARRLRAYVGNSFAGSPGTLFYMTDIVNALYKDAASQDQNLVDMLDGNQYDRFVERALGRYSIETIGGQDALLVPDANVDVIQGFLSSPAAQVSVIAPAIANADAIADYDLDILERGSWYPVFTKDGYQLRTGDPLSSLTWADSRGTPILLDLAALSSITLVQAPTRRRR